jgi:hypothetical protein
MNAFDRLLVGYADWGGYRYHGWTSYEDPRNFQGPVVWSERDCDLRFAFELEREWPRAVHIEFAIPKASRVGYDPVTEKFQRVDVAISDFPSSRRTTTRSSASALTSTTRSSRSSGL